MFIGTIRTSLWMNNGSKCRGRFLFYYSESLKLTKLLCIYFLKYLILYHIWQQKALGILYPLVSIIGKSDFFFFYASNLEKKSIFICKLQHERKIIILLHFFFKLSGYIWVFCIARTMNITCQPLFFYIFFNAWKSGYLLRWLEGNALDIMMGEFNYEFLQLNFFLFVIKHTS